MSGPCCTDEGTDLWVDDDGSVLIAGYRGSIDLDYDGKIDIPTFGRPDALVSKVKLVGDKNLGWTRGPGGPKQDRADGVAPDRRNGVYAVGLFTDRMQMSEQVVLRSAGGADGFLARYGADSKLMWGRAIGGAGDDRMWRVASDRGGNAYLIGTAGGPVDVDGDWQMDVLANKDGQALVVSFSPEGTPRWWRASGGDAGAWGVALATGPNDEIYVGGVYRNGAPDFDADGKPDLPVSKQTSAEVVAKKDAFKYEYNGFYARLNGDGSLRWIRGVTGPTVQTVAALAVAANGDLLVLGDYAAAPDFDGDGAPDLEFHSMAGRIWQYYGDVNTYLMRVGPDGDRVWAKRFTAPARHVAVRDQRIVVSGAYSGALDVDDDGVPERASDGDDQREGFSIVLDDRGNVRQVLTVVGDHHDIVNAAGFSPDGRTLYLTGFTSLGADFDGDGKVEASSVCHKAGELYLAVYALADQAD
jgi:hypothetical protein